MQARRQKSATRVGGGGGATRVWGEFQPLRPIVCSGVEPPKFENFVFFVAKIA